MKHFPPVDRLTPDQFERKVKVWLESVAGPLDDFTASHQERLVGNDGAYVFDVTARFQAFGGAKFLLLIECKKQTNPVKREVVQVLADKCRSVGGSKCMMISTARFQSGAVEYAAKHGIALIQIVSGSAIYIQNSTIQNIPKASQDAEDFAGLFYGQNSDGRLIYPQLINLTNNHELALFLGLPS